MRTLQPAPKSFLERARFQPGFPCSRVLQGAPGCSPALGGDACCQHACSASLSGSFQQLAGGKVVSVCLYVQCKSCHLQTGRAVPAHPPLLSPPITVCDFYWTVYSHYRFSCLFHYPIVCWHVSDPVKNLPHYLAHQVFDACS